jgi:hypothetical protein
MSDTENSNGTHIKYQNSQGVNLLEDKINNKKQQSTDTDYYFNMIANPTKTSALKIESESSEIDLIKSDSSSSSDSRKSRKSDSSNKKSSSRSEKKSSESKETYEQIKIPPPPPNTYKTNDTYNHSKQDKPTEPPKVELSYQETRLRKIEMLRKLSEIKTKGFTLSKEYDFNSSLEEMEYEFELLKSFADKRNGVKIFKGGLLQAVSVIEFLNDKYDPFDFHLSGWGDHLQLEVDSWEDVLEEIYEKYKGSGKKMAPEIKLLYLIIASGSAFHFSKSQASKLPGLDSMLASNPALLSKIINPGKGESSQFMTPQELNIEKQREELRKKEAEAKQKIQQQMQQQMQQQQMQQQSYIEQLQSQLQRQNEMISNQQNLINKSSEPATYGAGFSNASYNEPQPANSKPTALPKQIPASQLRPIIPSIQAPDQVKSILDRIHNLKSSNIKPSNTETQDETSSNNDRIVEETTISESNPNKKKTGRKPKKSNISIF